MIREVGAIAHDWTDVMWSIRRRRSMAYLGWVNRGNLGDESMFAAVRHVLGGDLQRAPLHKAGRFLASGGSCETLIVGGGTLLGRPEWTERVLGAQACLNPSRTVVVGTGVEDPAFGSDRGTTSSSAFNDVAEVLGECSFVGVRGPHSQQTLTQLGVSSRVIGDPALAFSATASTVSTPSRTVLINLAGVADGLVSRRQKLADAVWEAAEKLESKGWTIRFFAMEKADEEFMRLALPKSADILAWSPSVTRMIECIDNCSAVLSERLHGGILAAARNRSFVQISYKPKVFDFLDSIGAGDHAFDASEVDAANIVERVEQCVRTPLSADVWESVQMRARDFIDGAREALEST